MPRFSLNGLYVGKTCVVCGPFVGLKRTFANGYAGCMALVRKHIALNDTTVKIVEKLSVRWGLDFSNTVRHCIMLIAQQESIAAEPQRKPARKSTGAPD